MPPGDQNREWPALFIIENVNSAGQAQQWGDHLAQTYCEGTPDERAIFLRSYVSTEASAPGDLSRLPVIPYGYEASHEEIGW